MLKRGEEARSRLGKITCVTCALGIVALVALLVLGGCGLSTYWDDPWFNEDNDPGDLVLSFDKPIGPLIITPGVDNYTITYFICEIEHDVTLDTMSDTAILPETTVTFANIPSGDYSITCTSYNVYDEAIAFGSGSVTVLANDTSSETVQTTWIVGDGTLHVDYTLTPSDLLFSPGIEAELMGAMDVWAPVTVTESSPGVWYTDELLPSGFGAIRHELHSYGDSDMHVGGGLEAFLIMAGKTTAGAYAYSESVITPPTTGSTIIIIHEPIDQPFQIVFLDGLTIVDTELPFTLTASADVAVVAGDWRWAKNGVIIGGEVNDSLTVTATDEERFDNYSVMAQYLGALSSAEKLIEQVTPPPELAAISWTTPAGGGPVYITQEAGTYFVTGVAEDAVSAPLPDGLQLWARIGAASDPDVITYVTVQTSPITLNSGDGSFSFTIVNSTSLGNNDLNCYVEIGGSAGFTAPLFTAHIVYGNY